VISKDKNDLSSLDGLPAYLKSTTLDTLLAELKAKGITQKAFAESIGMNPQHLGAVKSSEQRNHFFNELGAIKLACLWMLEIWIKSEPNNRERIRKILDSRLYSCTLIYWREVCL
jgi:transcriptional regulator with XRE-family HTH domain